MNASIAASPAGAYELAYREGTRALDEQAVATEAVRTRAGLLLSAAAIATSFLGGAALEGGPSLLSWVAIAAFTLLGVGVIVILWPRGDLEHVSRPGLLVSAYAEPATLELPLIHRDLALHMDASYLNNRGYLRRLVTTFRGCSLLLLAEIVLWIVDLITKG